MNNTKRGLSGKNFTKSLIFLLVTLLIILLAFSVPAIFMGLFSSPGSKPFLAVIIFLELILTVTLFVTLFRFFKAVDTVNNQAELLAHGKLNISDILPGEARGLEILARAFNDMKSNLLSFIELTKTNIITISDAIDNVSKSMDNSYLGNEQIATSMGNVAEKAQEQSKLMAETMANIDEVGKRIESITSSIEIVEKSVAKTVQATTVGVQNLDEYYEQVNVISDNLNSTSEYIKKLNEDITQIDQIGKFIIQISEQLKLLGLNASVEAAKAGESGKGFAVVAHEMNLLSTATKESIGKINTILKNIDRSSSFVSNSIDSCIENYGTSRELFKSIKESFEIINSSASSLEADIKKVYSEISLINNSTHEISNKSLLLHQASEEISTKTQEVAAVTQEELAELEEINNYTSSLQNMLTGIENLVKKFRTSVVPVDADSPKQLRIAFISPLDHDFWYGVRQGVLYAQKVLADRNVVIDYRGFKQDVGPEIRRAVEEAIDNGVDGIITPGFVADLIPMIETAYHKGIPFMVYNCDFPEKTKRVAYFGPDVNSAGTLAARLMAKAIDGKGEVVLLTGGLDAFVHRTRRETILAELKKYRGIKIYGEARCADNPELTYNTTKEFLRQNSNIRGIFVTGGTMAATAKAVDELGFTGKTFVVCFDYNKEIYEYIRKGTIAAAIGQDPFGQGHDPIIYLYNMLVTGEKPENEIIWTRLEVVDQNNVDDLL